MHHPAACTTAARFWRHDAGMQLTIATLNILGTADRWTDRFPLIAGELARLRPDVMALQEVDFFAGQDRKLAERAPLDRAIYRAAEHDEFGNGLLVLSDLVGGIQGVAAGGQRVELGENRVALVLDVPIRPEGETARHLRVVTTHLHWVPDEPQKRVAQVRRLIDWLAEHTETRSLAATVIAGDLNATPDEPACGALRDAGFRSAYEMVHGAEPEWTYPSPMTPKDVAVRPASCIDYIWLFGAVGVQSADTAFGEPAMNDSSLYPSDHRGIVATLEL